MPDRVRVRSVSDFADGKLHAVDAAGTSVVVGFAASTPTAAAMRLFRGRHRARHTPHLNVGGHTVQS